YIFSDDYKEKMRFIAGPRQTGKTTLAVKFLKEKKLGKLYYNWDRREVRDKYHKNPYFYSDDILGLPSRNRKWICFDEIHKMPKWKNILKDFYDAEKGKIRFIITGSARLDLLRKSGDSLAGRYFLFHLFPISLRELVASTERNNYSMQKPEKNGMSFVEKNIEEPKYYQKELDLLLKFSGFPEPLSETKKNIHKMWQNNYLDAVLKEDLRDLSGVRNLENVANLFAVLPTKIGSPLSINSLINDVEMSYPAIKNYLYLLELGYLIFKISSYTGKIVRSIKKEKKYYFFDWTRVEDLSFRFENYIAFELFNLITFWKDNGFGDFGLYFIKNRNGQETDFLITKNNTPWLMLEAKLNDENVANHNIRQAEALGNIPLVQVIYKNNIARKISKNIFVLSASRFFS
ncbi:AAA family ATPase, partial [Patescibacteria group bacterium]|nr:AAA family ATPase [Patescibacteria group bacterium]